MQQKMKERIVEVGSSPKTIEEESADEDEAQHKVVWNPWQTGVYQRPVEENNNNHHLSIGSHYNKHGLL